MTYYLCPKCAWTRDTVPQTEKDPCRYCNTQMNQILTEEEIDELLADGYGALMRVTKSKAKEIMHGQAYSPEAAKHREEQQNKERAASEARVSGHHACCPRCRSNNFSMVSKPKALIFNFFVVNKTCRVCHNCNKHF